ncbi:metal ABC transporter substrate-binding protein [Streptomyces sp. DSM 44915]|uniref:Metal ABC transporter substrate-binding protein n=2 Tax=Streptomyces chisholmiae TaxID=3075540 RepID=A0ABU2K2K3_9ACTN|nr:metal ABC transporter substrate-binding protein [Streptomyces sp. DSM 44915]MDT0270803.1 metal ABC transporter substrate-binding protein [Streptomyces sp. DSM 44915]
MTDRRRRARPRIATAATAALAATSLLTLTGCGLFDDEAGGDSAGTSDGPLDVVASFYPMAFLAERIGGEHVSVSTLTGPGVEPHDLDISPQQTAQVADADVVVYLQGLQPAVDEAIAQSATGEIADVTGFTSLESHEEEAEGEGEHADEGNTHDDEHADEGNAHGDEHADEGHAAEDEHADEGHSHDDHGHSHDHDIDGLDPHIWLDPAKYGQLAMGVAAALTNADPDHMADFEANATELINELDALDAEFTEGLAEFEGDTFITTHSAFGYLAARYGLHEESITGLDPESEPSGARMRELREIAEADGVTTIFFETLVSDETARTLADDLGLQTAVLDPLEGITEESAGADYLEVMRANLAALQTALGG